MIQLLRKVRLKYINLIIQNEHQDKDIDDEESIDISEASHKSPVAKTRHSE